jgi:DNA polymerase III sliding clamp (beta) subunit (PCNA family)
MNRSNLIRALELVQPAVAGSDLVPIFSCFMFKTNHISAYNDQLGIEATFDCGDTPFAVNAITLLGLLKNIHTEEVEFNLQKNDLEIKAGKSNLKLPFFTQEEFLFEEPEEQWLAALPINEDLTKGLEICLTTASNDNSQPAIMGVCFNFGKASTLYSCDGDAVTRFTLAAKPSGKGIFTVSNTFCNALLKICAETKITKGKLDLGEGWVRASLENGYTLYGRLILNESPLNHAELIEKTMTGESPFVDVPLGFDEALARARVVADSSSASTSLTIKKGSMSLFTETPSGVVEDTVKIKGHDDVEATIHASLVCRSLNICNEISIRENCVSYRSGDTVLQVVSNIG